jgi:hypothetical protein
VAACLAGAPFAAATAQEIEMARPATAPAKAAAAAERALLGLPDLWPIDSARFQWMFVDGNTIRLTRQPTADGYTADTSGLWSGPFPAGMQRANTAVSWAGTTWAMVMLPLPQDSIDAARLLVHEAMHTMQPRLLPRPPYSEIAEGSDLLDGPEGRTWLLLEMRAMATALDTSGEARRSAVRDGLLFHAMRLRLATEAERTRERALELSEGLPEYTAWRLVSGTPAELANHIRSEERRGPSWVRQFPYLTGPALAWAADLGDPTGAWRRHVDYATDLAVAAGRAWHLTPPDSSGIPAAARAAAIRYGGDALRASEAERWKTHLAERASLTAAFVTGPVLRLVSSAMRISFDPNRSAPVGRPGTVMRALEWRGADGAHLVAPDGALVPPAWGWLQMPLGQVVPTEGALAAPVHWTGPGWTLDLPAGWRAHHDGKVWILTAPPGAVRR